MSQELERIAERLRDIAGRLRDPSLDDQGAEELAREAADLAARAGSEAEATLRESTAEPNE